MNIKTVFFQQTSNEILVGKMAKNADFRPLNRCRGNNAPSCEELVIAAAATMNGFIDRISKRSIMFPMQSVTTSDVINIFIHRSLCKQLFLLSSYSTAKTMMLSATCYR